MVTVLISGSSGLFLALAGQGYGVVFLAKTFNLTVPLSTQVRKWVPALILMLRRGLTL